MRVSRLQEPAGQEGGPAKSGKEQYYGSVVGAARLGERASIGNGYFMAAHGGAVRPSGLATKIPASGGSCLATSIKSDCNPSSGPQLRKCPCDTLLGPLRALQIESLLDEATAELGKMEFSPMLSTIEADFKIRKKCPTLYHSGHRVQGRVILHSMGPHRVYAWPCTSVSADVCLASDIPCPHPSAGQACLKIDVRPQIRETKGMRCWVNGKILDSNGSVLATCAAQLVDLQQLWAAQGQGQ